MISKKKRLLLKIASIVTIASIMIVDLLGVNQQFVMAAEKQTVYFGSYYQEEVTDENYISRLKKVDFVNDKATVEGIDFARKNGHYYYSTPIEWEVLEQDDDNYLLISKKILDYHTFTDFWHKSDMRSWLNEEFINIAFSSEEKLSMNSITQITLYHPYEDAYIDRKEPQYIETSDYVTLLDENEVQKAAYGYDSGKEEAESRVAYGSAYANLDEKSDRWWIRGSAVWNYGNLQEKYITSKGAFSSWYGTYSYGVRPVVKVKKSAISTIKPNVNYDFSLFDYDAEKEAIDALPDLTNLGSDTINGPEVKVNDKKFNLWKSGNKISIGLKDKVTAKYDPKNETVELIIGLGKYTAKEIKTSDPNTDGYDSKWKDTYSEIKSMVEACGHKTNRETWNKFQKTREKLQDFDADAVYKVKGSIAGYMKIQMNGTKVTDILESGMVANFEAGASVKNPLFWVVYSEFGISGSIEGKMYVDYLDSYSYKGSLGLTIEPSLAIGADVLVVDVKGGLKGNIKGNVDFPWKSFKENVNVSLSGSFFLKVDTFVPGLSASESWNWPTVELYPDLGKVPSKSVNLKYSAIKPPSNKEIVKSLKAEKAITEDASSAVYENAKPNMVLMDDGNYLVTYLDEVKVGDKYQAKLVYRIGDGVTWSDPIIVNSNTVFDTAAKLVKHNGKYYLIYTGGKSAINVEQGIDEIAGSLDLYISTLENGSIMTSQVIGESGKFKYDYDLVVNNDTVTAVWAENDANDILLEKGGTVVYNSTLSDTKWGDVVKLFSSPDAIETISAGVFDNKVSVAYIYDDRLFVNGNKKTTGLSEILDGAKIFDGKVYLRNGGVLYSYDGSKSSSTNVSCGVDYQVHGSNVYWIQQQNFKSEIYGQKIGSDMPIPITNDDSYIGSLCIADNGTNNSIVYTSQMVDDGADDDPYGVTLLKYKDTLSRFQADVTNIAYDILEYTPKKSNDFTFYITNNGTEELHNISLVVNSGDANIYSDLVMEKLEVGESRSVKVSIQIPENATEIEAYVKASEILEDGKSKHLTLEKASGNISLEKTEEGNLNIANTSSDEINNITLNIKNSQYGEVIRNVVIDSLSAGESKIIEIERKDWLKSTKIEEIDDYYFLYCEISYDDTEMKLDDNSVCLCLIDNTLTQEREDDTNLPQTPIPDKKPENTPSPSPSPSDSSNGKNDLSSKDKTNTDDKTNNKVSPSKVSKPGKVTGLKVKNKKKQKMTVSWNWKVNVSGFQIQYAQNKKFTKKKKSKMVGKWTSQKTITKLKKGKTYYVRVRTYKKSSGKRIYGKWSKIKKIKIKK